MIWRIFFLASFVFVSLAYAQEGDYPHGDFAGNCTDCHNEEKWMPVVLGQDWQHPRKFNLRGTHRAVPCINCHKSLDFTKAEPYCASCHSDVHRGEMGSDCSLCHTPTNFLDPSAQRERHRLTRFPLFGAHALQDCESCHPRKPQGNLTWVGNSTECVSCHLQHYNNATNPNHRAGGFPTTCEQCHTPRLWERARVVHSSSMTNCVNCHLGHYNAATNPNHRAAGFPLDCSLCHTPTLFSNGVFTNHDGENFPIYSGQHRNRWSACSDCHPNPSNYSQLGCRLCHAGDQNWPANGNHSPALFVEPNCIAPACHPTGEKP